MVPGLKTNSRARPDAAGVFSLKRGKAANFYALYKCELFDEGL